MCGAQKLLTMEQCIVVLQLNTSLQRKSVFNVRKNGTFLLCSSTADLQHISNATTGTAVDSFFSLLSCRCLLNWKVAESSVSLCKKVMSLPHTWAPQPIARGRGRVVRVAPPPLVQFSEQDWTALNNGWKLEKSYKETPHMMRFHD